MHYSRQKGKIKFSADENFTTGSTTVPRGYLGMTISLTGFPKGFFFLRYQVVNPILLEWLECIKEWESKCFRNKCYLILVNEISTEIY